MKRTAGKAEVCELVNLDDVDDAIGFRGAPVCSRGMNKRSAISVEQHAEERDLQAALVASLQFSNVKTEGRNKRWTANHRTTAHSVIEQGECSNSKPEVDFLCGICAETKPETESFPINGCKHSYCRECVVKYVESKLQDNICHISCPVPDCSSVLDPQYCCSILPREVFERWDKVLCEGVILEYQKFYCPFRDCSAMLINDGETAVRESECPNCRRLFCAQCKVSWHSDIDCEEFQKLHRDEREREDILLMKLAEGKQWRRCPTCRIFVERTDGCRYMKCRCGANFCYSCGTTKIDEISHYCIFCKG